MTNKQMISMLKHFQTFSPLLKKLFVLHCDSSFILFIAELLLNVIEGNLRVQSKTQLQQYEPEIAKILEDRNGHAVSIKSKRRVLATNHGLQVIALLYKPTIDHFAHLQ